MKKTIYICLCLMIGWGCEDLQPLQNQPHTVATAVAEITETSAACAITIEPLGATRKAGIIYGTDPALQANTAEASAVNVSGSNASVTLSGLKSETTYYVKAYAADRSDYRVYGDIQSFTTQKIVTMNPSATSIVAAPAAGSYTLKVTSNGAWTVTSNQPWCTVQPASGTGDGEVIVTVTTNPEETDRTATLTITAGAIQRQITVKQTGKDITLDTSTALIEAAATAGSHTLTVMCNDAWTVVSNQSWCTVQPSSGTGNGEITVTVTANPEEADRTATLTVEAGSTTRQVSVQQRGEVLTVFGNGIVAAENYGGGDGTQGNPYLISDVRHLKKLVDDTNRGQDYSNSYFKLTIDIQVTVDEWIPIGASYNESFSGVFDGDGHTISGTLKSANYVNFGFFMELTGGATVSNMTIAAAVKNEYSSTDDGISTGALAGSMNESNIHNCHISGSVTGGAGIDSHTGGIVGTVVYNSTIRDCNLSGTVKGGYATLHSHAGGMAGYVYTSENRPMTISNCTVFGSITGGESAGESTAGGIAGNIDGRVNITNCTISASGNVTAGNGQDGNIKTGGIAGMTNVMGSINGCTNHAPVTGKSGYTGGLIGSNNAEIHTSLNTGSVTSSGSYIGGLVGYNSGNVYSCCTNRGTVNGQPASSENQVGYGSGVTPCPDGHAKR